MFKFSVFGISMYIRILLSAFFLGSISTSVFAQNALISDDIQIIQAENATETHGNVERQQDSLSQISSGDWFSINTKDLGVGVDLIAIRYAKGDWPETHLEIRSGSLTGNLIASGNIPSTERADRYRNVYFPVDYLKGENELFFIFSGEGNIGNIDRVVFGRAQENRLYSWLAKQTHGGNRQRWSFANLEDGDRFKFRNIRMGNGFSQFSTRYSKSDDQINTLTLHLDNIDGPIIGEVDLPPSNGRRTLISNELTAAEGTHDIYVNFSGPGTIDLFDYVNLESQPLVTELPVANASRVAGMRYIDNDKALALIKGRRNQWLRFDNTSVSYSPKIELSYARASNPPMKLEVRRWTINGRLLGTIDLPKTGSLDNYETVSLQLKNNPQGVYGLAFRFVGQGEAHIGDIKLIRIDENPPPSPLGEINADNIVIDQFGYRPEMKKVAILRDGQVGLGSTDADYIPGDVIALVDKETHEIVFSGASETYLNGATDPLSGDRVWTFDFSEIDSAGTYYIYDSENNARSVDFEINENIYDNVLRAAFRTFIYQRSGFDKTAEIVGNDYVDSASHSGPLQDSGARLFDDQRNPETERDLQGGWYDAGDFTKYSNWTSDYILGLLHAYHANPAAWSDDWDLPDSGNGIPDILDEVRWGVEHLQRMQETNSETNSINVGGVLSVLESDDRLSPASANIENSFYGPPTTSATFTAAAAFAFASSSFKTIEDQAFQNLADSLAKSAELAYQWAQSNPDIRFNNPENDVGNGNSEVTEDYFLGAKRRMAAIYLYELTQEEVYQTFIEKDYKNSRFITHLWASPYEVEEPTAMLHLSTLSGIDPVISTRLRDQFSNIMEFSGNARPALDEDPYRSYIQEYVWGSNKTKSRKGHMFAQLAIHDIGDRPAQENLDAAAGYLHYIHGVNPLGKVYLSNMNALGAERSVDEMYHRWFIDGSPWDNVNTSFGPPPGYLVGGANQYYDGSLQINQPPMKSYIETNSFLNNEQCWQLTENSNGYQIEYLKLLSQFVD